MARRGYFEKKQIKTIDWSVPDLSPTENILAIIKNKVFERASEITGADYDD